MMDCQLWADVCKLALGDVRFILCGDFQQFPDVCEHWAGCSVQDGALEHSDMVQDLAGSNRLTLKTNMRSDQELFDFYTGLTDRPLAEALLEARARFPCTSRVAETTLVISHVRRRFINRQRNRHDKPRDAVYLRAPMSGKTGTGPEPMWVWPGLRLVGAGCGQVKKGVFETVATVSEADGVVTVTLHSGLSLVGAQAVRTLRLCSAITYASCQGLTLHGVVRLDCTESSHFTCRHLYVGSSRCTSHQLLEIS